MAVSAEAVLTAALSLATYVGDRGDSPEQRAELYRPVTNAIAEVSRSRTEAAMLLALAFHESGFARFVIEGRCSDGPRGQRCDGGRARGVFQLHESACRDAWALPDGSVESIREEARCAIRLLRWNADRGKAHTPTREHAAFAGYAARAWSWDGADKRVETTRKIEEALGRTPRGRRTQSASGRPRH